MDLPNGAGESMAASANFEWLEDPAYLPSLAEALDAQNTSEGKAAIDHLYYRSTLGRERFEIWTREYIGALSEHIIETLADCESPEGTVLEVGAGEGRLSALLRRDLSAKDIGALVVATDARPPRATTFPVEALSYGEALDKYKPTVAISSWMPQRHEWTWKMRATPSLQEYIVIGSPAICGSISTWRGYSSPELGEFRPVQLHHLDAMKTGQFSNYREEPDWLSLTRGFRRISDAPV